MSSQIWICKICSSAQMKKQHGERLTFQAWCWLTSCPVRRMTIDTRGHFLLVFFQILIFRIFMKCDVSSLFTSQFNCLRPHSSLLRVTFSERYSVVFNIVANWKHKSHCCCEWRKISIAMEMLCSSWLLLLLKQISGLGYGIETRVCTEGWHEIQTETILREIALFLGLCKYFCCGEYMNKRWRKD